MQQLGDESNSSQQDHWLQEFYMNSRRNWRKSLNSLWASKHKPQQVQEIPGHENLFWSLLLNVWTFFKHFSSFVFLPTFDYPHTYKTGQALQAS